jgi:hypothetical protein
MNILSLEFLDKIISILKTQNKKITAHEINILFITDDFYSLYRKEFQLGNYLPILIKDGYVKETEELSEIEGFGSSNVKYYSLTAEGLSFIGYVDTNYSKLSLEQENKLLRLSQIELNRSTLSTNRRMIWLTRWISLGTIIAAFYYLIEILKFYKILCVCNGK